MKKILLLIFTLCLGVKMFAAEFIIAPTAGYDNHVNLGVFQHGASVGLSIGTVTNSSFTFYWDNNFTINPGDNSYHTEGFVYRTALLFGRTFYFLDGNLRLGVTGGVDFAISAEYLRKEVSEWTMGLILMLGPCVHLNLDYYFTKNIGITFTITECPNLAFFWLPAANSFSIELGPSFKF